MHDTQQNKVALGAVLAILCVLGLCVAAPASAAVVTFDSAPLGAFTHYTQDGFNFDWVGTGVPQAFADVGGRRELVDSMPGDDDSMITITAVNGGQFTLDSLTAANFGAAIYRDDMYVLELDGYQGGDMIAEQQYSVLPATYTEMVPVSVVGQEFDRLDINIHSNTAYYAVSGITLTQDQIPEPATMTLLALGGAVAMLRRRRAA